MSERRFYVTTYVITVLSEDGHVENLNPHEVADAIDTGDCVGDVSTSHEEVTAERMAELLAEFGSTPDFFQLGEDDAASDPAFRWRCLDCEARGNDHEFKHDPEAARCPECNSINVTDDWTTED